MNEERLCTIEQIEQFLSASASIEFSASGDDSERYGHISRVLKRFDYPRRGKRERGVLLRYLERTSGYSRAQVTRLVTRWQRNRLAEVPLAKRHGRPTVPFARKYTPADIALLVEMDKANEDACGPAIAHLLQRAYRAYGDPRYERLATLSVSHLYNLRKSAGYQAQRKYFTSTRQVCNAIGVRKAPGHEGRAGFVRIDTVHQGDLDGIKGVYHITCVDAVSQWQVQACVQGIGEAHLLPVLALIIDQFPFVVLGFHSDNGSEYINHQVAKMLDKLRVEFTKSRPYHSNDNGLAETKNGAVVRKHFGYEHIPQHWASEVNALCRDFLNPYLNFHRPCLFPESVTDAKGKTRKRYPLDGVMTPFEKLKSIPTRVSFLKPSITLDSLEIESKRLSDNESAKQLQQAKQQLFLSIHNRSKVAA